MLPARPLVVIAPSPTWQLAVVLVVLLAIALAAATVGRLGVRRMQLLAAIRATVQLGVVSLVIAAALRSVWWSAAFAALMFAVASLTSTRRIGVPLPGITLVGLAILCGALPVLALILGSGVIPFNGAGLVPTAGIIIGNAMTGATLTGRRAFDELKSQAGTYEAALAIGLPSPEAAYEVVGPTAREALIPSIDQTRTVGLVTLPGAFIGVLLGGGSAVQAGAAQLLVLIGVLAAQAITAAVLLQLVSRGRLVRRDLAGWYPR
ncbi:MAG TPA: ABC transporter permease [Marmoricola sp.]